MFKKFALAVAAFYSGFLTGIIIAAEREGYKKGYFARVTEETLTDSEVHIEA